MKLAKTRRADQIRRFLLEAAQTGNTHPVQGAVETFHVSRQTIHRHLSVLVDKGFLLAEGNTRSRTYKLGPVRAHTAIVPLKDLQESDVYSREFAGTFSGLPKTVEEICHYGFTEILNNAIDHSQGTTATITVERRHQSIQIMISDNGEGIFGYITRILSLHDPRESLLELSKGKLTTDPENHTGQGIFFTSRAFDNFLIISGELVFSHNDAYSSDYLLHNQLDHKGTHVLMEIALNSQKDLSVVFSDFTGTEDEDYTFNKTIVPVKLALYEGDRLISRSQAKRILNRVEHFKYVMLDFQDIDFIGQAFADEVFRVFINKNPQILIQSINTSSNISKAITAAVSGQ